MRRGWGKPFATGSPKRDRQRRTFIDKNWLIKQEPGQNRPVKNPY
jgi:hypothetical protein